MTVLPNKVFVETKKLPHLMKYMGSKREIINFISDSIKSLGFESENVCDLFAGTGIVSGALKDSFHVHANDIQKYSQILSSMYLLKKSNKINLETVSEIDKKVKMLSKEFNVKYSGLIFSYDNSMSMEEFKNVELKQQNLIHNNFDIGFHLFTKYYSGTYWSFSQCVEIDSIRAVAEEYIGAPEYYIILSALIYAMSYTSQSTGHYAQYRDATSQSSMLDILLYRQRQIWPYFEKKLTELIAYVNTDSISTYSHKSTTLDYMDCLRIIEENTIVYADPPYQSVHYSRFYHAVETLVKYDYPKVFYKGRYRDDRHQSPFCIRSTVDSAFKMLFKSINAKNSHLVLSYSDTGMISLNKLEEIAKEILDKKYSYNLLEKGHIHSTMGRNDSSPQNVTEFLLSFKRQ